MHSQAYNHLINQQADGMAPMPKFCTPDSLFNPHFPNEDFHLIFPEEMKRGTMEEVSPFVNTALAVRIMNAQHDLIRRNAKTPEEGMREMTHRSTRRFKRRWREIRS